LLERDLILPLCNQTEVKAFQKTRKNFKILKNFIKNILVFHFFMFLPNELFWKKLCESKWETVVRTLALANKLSL